MNLTQRVAVAAALAAAVGVAGTAQAAFEGRDATGAPSATCTASGPTKCTYFYDTTLDITILNTWNIGPSTWSAGAAPGSVQALVAAAGEQASGLSGWVLPTGDGLAPAGAQNQYASIWNAVGGTFAGLSNQFDRPQASYWSSSDYAPDPNRAWSMFLTTDFDQPHVSHGLRLFGVAVRPGDVAVVPEPRTYALLLAGLGVMAVAVRRRRYSGAATVRA